MFGELRSSLHLHILLKNSKFLAEVADDLLLKSQFVPNSPGPSVTNLGCASEDKKYVIQNS
jgi:hypothetical protein